MLPDLTQKFVADLIDFGAVYHNKSRLTEDAIVSPGDNIRVHASPRRYSKVYSYDWKEALVHVDTNGGYLVVHKPRGVPVAATIDNAKETVINQLEEILDAKLFATTQMDVDTSGLLILATNRKFVGRFMKQLQLGTVKRKYRALVRPQSETRLLEPCFLTHYTYNLNRRTPRTFVEDLPTTEQKEGREAEERKQEREKKKKAIVRGSKAEWLKCEMQILSTRDCQLAWAPWDHQQELLQHVELEPVTGRTHQLRGQLACAGAPVLGDNLYTGTLEPDNETLVCPTTMGSRTRADSHRSPGLALQLYSLSIPAMTPLPTHGKGKEDASEDKEADITFSLESAWWKEFVQYR
jgi:23S rRNA-/tRNA-specific pseudouridylate synthase